MRKFLLYEEKIVRKMSIKILRLIIEIHPSEITNNYKYKLIPIVISKLFEDYKTYSFDERLECMKFMNIWLNNNPENFPLIFCQGLSAIAKSQDEQFKRGSIEFIQS